MPASGFPGGDSVVSKRSAHQPRWRFTFPLNDSGANHAPRAPHRGALRAADRARGNALCGRRGGGPRARPARPRPRLDHGRRRGPHDDKEAADDAAEDHVEAQDDFEAQDDDQEGRRVPHAPRDRGKEGNRRRRRQRTELLHDVPGRPLERHRRAGDDLTHHVHLRPGPVLRAPHHPRRLHHLAALCPGPRVHPADGPVQPQHEDQRQDPQHRGRGRAVRQPRGAGREVPEQPGQPARQLLRGVAAVRAPLGGGQEPQARGGADLHQVLQRRERRRALQLAPVWERVPGRHPGRLLRVKTSR